MDLQENIKKYTDAHNSNIMQIATFSIKGSKTIFGINIAKVRNFIRWKNFNFNKSFSNEDNLNLGLGYVRNEIIPIVNLNKWLKEPNCEEYQTLIICEFNEKVIGIPVEKIYRIFNKNSNELEKLNYLEEKITYITKVKLDDNKDIENICCILDVEQLLHDFIPNEFESKIENINICNLNQKKGFNSRRFKSSENIF